MFLNAFRFSGSLPLDLAAADAAYSLRLVRAAYAGSAIRVRRSSDDAELDIGFAYNSLDTAALLAHCGANSGFVTTWYDQSGNAHDATQATTSNQPRIVNAGALETMSGRPAVRFLSASSTVLTTAWVVALQARYYSLVWDKLASATTHVVMSHALVNIAQNAGEQIVGYVAVNGSGSLTQPAQAPGILTANTNNGSLPLLADAWVNGTSQTLLNAQTLGTAATFLKLGARDSGSYFDGVLAELLIGAANIDTTNRPLLIGNQGAYYGITVT